MIRHKIYLLSESLMRIFIDSLPSSDSVKMEFHASFDRKEYKKVAEKEIEDDTLLYDVNLSRNDLGNIYDAFVKIVFLRIDGTISEETRGKAAFVKSNPHTRGVVKLIQNDFKVSSRMNGGKAYFIKVKKDEGVCSSCWDDDLESSSDSNCKECGGTGYVRYFFSPYKTIVGPIANLSGESKSTDEVGKISNNTTSSTSSYADFSLSVDDYVFSTVAGAVMRVVETSISKVQGNQVLQTISMQEVPTDMQETETIHSMLNDKFGDFYAR